jgi:prefoldin subunit 5
MGEKEQLKRMLEGIEDEITELEKNCDGVDDADSRIKELKKEAESLKEDLRK